MASGSSKGRRGVHWGVARSILIGLGPSAPATALAGAAVWGALSTWASIVALQDAACALIPRDGSSPSF